MAQWSVPAWAACCALYSISCVQSSLSTGYTASIITSMAISDTSRQRVARQTSSIPRNLFTADQTAVIRPQLRPFFAAWRSEIFMRGEAKFMPVLPTSVPSLLYVHCFRIRIGDEIEFAIWAPLWSSLLQKTKSGLLFADQSEVTLCCCDGSLLQCKFASRTVGQSRLSPREEQRCMLVFT